MNATEQAVTAGGAAGAGAAPDVKLVELAKRFGDLTVVDGISVEIDRGQFFALLGPSGCGKTTTLRMIGGFEEPTSGEVWLGDREVTGLQPHKRDVNTVFQSYALFPHLSIFENVAFGLRRRGVRKAELQTRVGEALELVGLSGVQARRPKQLSGGQQQRIALARALVNRPRVLLLDEPLGALDLKLRRQMQLELKRIQEEVGITFVHVTHDQEEAMTMADSIAVMNGGRIEQLGSPAELYEEPQTAFVAGFLGVSNLLRGTVAGDGTPSSSTAGAPSTCASGALDGRSGRVAVGVRPEKVRLGASEANVVEGRVSERAYIGVSTQYVVTTEHGPLVVYIQNTEPGAHAVAPGDAVTLSFSPDAAFVVDPARGGRVMNSTLDPRGAPAPRPCRRRRARTAGSLRRPRRRSVRWRPAPSRSPTGRSTSTGEGEPAPEHRPVHEEDRHQGQVHRGRERQRRLLREDPGAARPRRVDRPRHHHPDRQLAVSGIARPEGLGREARQEGHPEHQEPPAERGASRPGTRIATTASPGRPG